MNIRENHIAYFTDMARRHASIAHDPDTAAGRRFFLEADEDLMANGAFPNNTGFNMILSPFYGRSDMKNSGYTAVLATSWFRIVKQSKQQNEADINSTINQCWDIAWEIWLQMKEHTEQCMAMDTIQRLSAGIEHLRYLDLASLQWYEVGPMYDNHYGYEFGFTCKLDTPLAMATTPGNWRSI